MVGMLEACMEVTTETGMTGDRRRPSRPKYTTKRNKPEKIKKRGSNYTYTDRTPLSSGIFASHPRNS